MAKLLKHTNCFAMVTDTICVLQDRFTRTLIGAGEERDGVYYFTDIVSAKSNKAVFGSDQALWHRRLGHPSFSVLSSLDLFSKLSSSASSSPCDVCFRAKQTREVFFDSLNKTTECFSLIHVDVWGPYRVPSSSGAVYFLTIVDDFSRAVWTYLLLEKSEVKRVLPEFLAYTEKQFNKLVRSVRSDNGTEFMVLSSFFREKGIIHQTSCMATPQQNGRVERKHCHILNVARSLLFQAHLPVKFWGEAILTAAYLINRTPTAIHNGRTPFEILHGVKPDYNQLKVFGSACYTHRASRDKDKFGERSRLCVFVGYPFGIKARKVYDINKNEFVISHDVVFREDVFPYAEPEIVPSPPSPNVACDEDWMIVPEDRGSDAQTTSSPDQAEECISVTKKQNLPVPANDLVSHVVSPTASDVFPELSSDDDDTLSPVSTPPAEDLGRGRREKSRLVLLKDYITYNAQVDPSHALPSSSSSSTVQGNSFFPIFDFVSDGQFSPGHRAYLATITKEVIPKHFKEAVTQKVWDDAMVTEVVALEKKRTWDILDLPEDKEAIGSHWFSLARRTKLRKFGRARRSSRRPKVTILIWKDRYLSHASRRSGMKPFGSTMRPRLIFYRDMSGKRANEAHGGFGVSNGPSSSAKGLDRIEKRPG
ncbi:unnamed protein product [Microthlaspi erraticum]|uniref:Integrase catalytic domain-containing protein n=1 Tax=Microthlaspi erraticum TaxID=1685480 RepID=A0A6D2IH62_9BRAS|nr:unnamed protein product [Microthlaspi erraticum]